MSWRFLSSSVVDVAASGAHVELAEIAQQQQQQQQHAAAPEGPPVPVSPTMVSQVPTAARTYVTGTTAAAAESDKGSAADSDSVQGMLGALDGVC
jgi:hypothetical protein